AVKEALDDLDRLLRLQALFGRDDFGIAHRLEVELIQALTALLLAPAQLVERDVLGDAEHEVAIRAQAVVSQPRPLLKSAREHFLNRVLQLEGLSQRESERRS